MGRQVTLNLISLLKIQILTSFSYQAFIFTHFPIILREKKFRFIGTLRREIYKLINLSNFLKLRTSDLRTGWFWFLFKWCFILLILRLLVFEWLILKSKVLLYTDNLTRIIVVMFFDQNVSNTMHIRKHFSREITIKNPLCLGPDNRFVSQGLLANSKIYWKLKADTSCAVDK